MIVKVTREHIENGQKNDCRYCPIGLALKDAGINTMTKERWVQNENGWIDTSATLSHRLETFASNFDNGKPVHPFSFRVRKP